MPTPKPYAEMTDADIVYYIDNDFFTFAELERLVGAKKNQLRNRYKRFKNQPYQLIKCMCFLHMHLAISNNSLNTNA